MKIKLKLQIGWKFKTMAKCIFAAQQRTFNTAIAVWKSLVSATNCICRVKTADFRQTRQRIIRKITIRDSVDLYTETYGNKAMIMRFVLTL